MNARNSLEPSESMLRFSEFNSDRFAVSHEGRHRFQRDTNDPSVIVFSETKRCQCPHFTQFFQKAKIEQFSERYPRACSVVHSSVKQSWSFSKKKQMSRRRFSIMNDIICAPYDRKHFRPMFKHALPFFSLLSRLIASTSSWHLPLTEMQGRRPRIVIRHAFCFFRNWCAARQCEAVLHIPIGEITCSPRPSVTTALP